MNVQTLRLRVHNWKQNIKSVWQKFRGESVSATGNQDRVMTEEEKLDEEIQESFPASDPPGHFSKSVEDQKMH
jgi:hypothetical protein